jgi:hypothetical protein
MLGRLLQAVGISLILRLSAGEGGGRRTNEKRLGHFFTTGLGDMRGTKQSAVSPMAAMK